MKIPLIFMVIEYYVLFSRCKPINKAIILFNINYEAMQIK